MKFEKSKLETIKNALQYAVISAKTESETAEFGLLLLEVQSGIESEKELEKRKKEMSSLDGCPFCYCDSVPKCESKCRYDILCWVSYLITECCLASVADNVNEIMKTKFNITSVFSAEKLNGNSAKQLL